MSKETITMEQVLDSSEEDEDIDDYEISEYDGDEDEEEETSLTHGSTTYIAKKTKITMSTDEGQETEEPNTCFSDESEDWGTVSTPISKPATITTPLSTREKRRKVTLLSAGGSTSKREKFEEDLKVAKTRKEPTKHVD